MVSIPYQTSLSQQLNVRICPVSMLIFWGKHSPHSVGWYQESCCCWSDIFTVKVLLVVMYSPDKIESATMSRRLKEICREKLTSAYLPCTKRKNKPISYPLQPRFQFFMKNWEYFTHRRTSKSLIEVFFRRGA